MGKAFTAEVVMNCRRLTLIGLGALASTLILTPVASASSEGGGKSNIFEIALDLGLWTVVVFGLLVFILRKYAWGPMLEGLHQREENISKAIEDAKAAREEAQKLRADLEADRAKIGEAMRDAMDEARRKAQQMADELQAKAKADIQADRDRLHRELDTARDQVLQDLLNRTTELATLISSKTIRRELTPDDHRRFIDEALVQLRDSGTEWQRERAGVL